MNIFKDWKANREYNKMLKSVKEFSERQEQNRLLESMMFIKGDTDGDIRYNSPKSEPKAAEDKVTETIENTEIYKRAKEHILNAQRKQVAYGLDKYPEPLNADTWSTIETIDHAIDESVDKMHYLVMLRIKLEEQAKELDDLHKYKRRIEELYGGAIILHNTGGSVTEMYEDAHIYPDQYQENYTSVPICNTCDAKGVLDGYMCVSCNGRGHHIPGVKEPLSDLHFLNRSGNAGKCWCE